MPPVQKKAADEQLALFDKEKESKEVAETKVEEPKDAKASALQNTVPVYTEPKDYAEGTLKEAVEVKEPVDTTKTERKDLLDRLDKALAVAPVDVVAMVESRLAHLVYEAESRVPGLV